MDERRRENAISTSRFQLRSEARLQAQYAKEVAQCAVKDRICDAPAAQYQERAQKMVCLCWLVVLLLGFSHIILLGHYNLMLCLSRLNLGEQLFRRTIWWMTGAIGFWPKMLTKSWDSCKFKSLSLCIHDLWAHYFLIIFYVYAKFHKVLLNWILI